MSVRSHQSTEDGANAKGDGEGNPSSPSIEVADPFLESDPPPTRRGEDDAERAVAAPPAPAPSAPRTATRRVAPPLPRAGSSAGAPRPVTRAFEALGSSSSSESRISRAPLRPSRTPTQRPPSGVPGAPPSAPLMAAAVATGDEERRVTPSGRPKIQSSAGSYSMAAVRAPTRLGLSAVNGSPMPTTTESAMRAVLPATVELSEASDRASGVIASTPNVLLTAPTESMVEVTIDIDGDERAAESGVLRDADDDSAPASTIDGDTANDLQTLVVPADPSPGDGAPLERFAASAPSALRVVRGFFVQVMQHTAVGEGVPAARAAVEALGRAAKMIGVDAVATLLAELTRAFSPIDDWPDGEPLPEGACVDLLRSYQPLADALPSAFALEEDTARRDAVILDALLRQIPLVNGVILAKLEARDVRTVGALASLDTPDTLAALAGIPLPLAARILEKAQSYLRDRKAGATPVLSSDSAVEATADSSSRAFDRERLMALAARLRFQHEGYEEAAKGWSDEANTLKRKLRQGRADAFLQVKVVLARMGELDRLAELERLPFERRVDELEEFLDRPEDEDEVTKASG